MRAPTRRTRTLWACRDIDAPASVLWGLLTDLERWPIWGPTVERAELATDRLGVGATGTVTTVGGLELGFEITAYEPGARWAWRVAGVAATDHVVQPTASDRCRVGFGVGWAAAPYLAVCHVALRRLERLAVEPMVSA